jgi:hypothetical protein
MTQDLHALRPVKPTVVVHPATHRGVDVSGQVLQALVVPGGSHPPLADGLPDPLGGLGAHRRQEADKEFPPAILGTSRLEGVAQKVECDVFVLSRPVVVLAVDDPRLRRMKLEAALRKPTANGLQHRPGVSLTGTVDDGIVRVTLEVDTRKRPLHPAIKRVVQEEICQQRTDDAALRRAFRPLLQCAVWTLHRSTQPPRNVQPDPRDVGVTRHGALDQIMRDGIKETFDVQVDDPVGVPAPLPRHPHRVERRLPRSIAVRVGVEVQVHHRLEHHLHHGLCNAIGYGWNAQRARAAAFLLNLDEPHRRWKIRAGRHAIPDLVEVVLQVLIECRQRLAIHTCGSSVRLHPLVRIPDELLRNDIRLCFRHRLLPSRVDRFPKQESRAPLLRPHYQASSLLRARPSLRLASVRSSSWVLHLDFSLPIEAAGSHVPHTSLRWAHAVFMPATTRTVSTHLPSSVPGQRLEPGFGDIPTLSTRHQRFTRVRLSST